MNEQLNRMEEMIAALIKMVGTNTAKLEEVAVDLKETKEELKADIKSLRYDIEFNVKESSMFKLELDRIKRMNE